MSTTTPAFRQDKLANLVLYVAERNLHNSTFGKTKLHKQLWMCDFHHYSLTGQAITGSSYIHREHGPFCKQLEHTLAMLEDGGRVAIRLRARFGYTQQHPVPLQRCDLAEFSAEEIASVEDVLWGTWHSSAKELSDQSHLHPGWQHTKDGQVILYEYSRVAMDLPFEEPLVQRSTPQALAD